jgi:uncharacterized protein YeaO (DUF488 family)
VQAALRAQRFNVLGDLRLKRIYEPVSSADGYRVLVERLWPRGVSKDAARLDYWLKEIAPSPELRRWYGHQPERWPEFQKRYRTELAGSGELVDQLIAQLQAGDVTLLFAAKDEARNSAALLKSFVEDRLAA